MTGRSSTGWLWAAAAIAAVIVPAAVGWNVAAQPARLVGPIRFENRQPSSGIDFVLHNGATPGKPIIDTMLGGVALLDYDRDGRPDVFFTNGASIPGLRKEAPGFLIASTTMMGTGGSPT